MMKKLDVKGLPCPQPVIQTKDFLESLEEGEVFQIVLDSQTSANNVKKFLNSQGHKIISEVEKGEEILLVVEKKGYEVKVKHEELAHFSCETNLEKKELFVILTNDVIGKDEALGKILIKGFFETMLVQNLLPDRMFFMNKGVFLTTKDEEIISLLRQIEKKGVEIYSCGTCLKYYGLEDQLKVGKRGGTDIYLEGVFFFKKTVWVG